MAGGRARRLAEARPESQHAEAVQRPSSRWHSDGNAWSGTGAARRPRGLAHALHSFGSRTRTGRRPADRVALMMRTVEANGTTIAFAQSGEGPPLLLLHGAEADHSMFDAFGALLASHFTVIASDQRDSGKTRNPPASYGFDEVADDAGALIAAPGSRSSPGFGTAFGGALAHVPAALDTLARGSL